jgi:hypothetical protein
MRHKTQELWFDSPQGHRIYTSVSFKASSGAHLASYPMGTDAFLPVLKRSWQVPQSSVDVENIWSCSATRPCVIKAWRWVGITRNLTRIERYCKIFEAQICIVGSYEMSAGRNTSSGFALLLFVNGTIKSLNSFQKRGL